MLRGLVLVLSGSCLLACASRKSQDAQAVPEAAPPAPEAAPATELSADAGSPEVATETAPAGSCTVSSLETMATRESRNDQCRGTFFCPGARTVLVTCDGENDGTNTSLCDCEERGKRASVSGTVPGEAPESCLAAADRCLAALGG
jgi:hypothetical protein